jgi:hypothetical protein
MISHGQIGQGLSGEGTGEARRSLFDGISDLLHKEGKIGPSIDFETGDEIAVVDTGMALNEGLANAVLERAREAARGQRVLAKTLRVSVASNQVLFHECRKHLDFKSVVIVRRGRTGDQGRRWADAHVVNQDLHLDKDRIGFIRRVWGWGIDIVGPDKGFRKQEIFVTTHQYLMPKQICGA